MSIAKSTFTDRSIAFMLGNVYFETHRKYANSYKMADMNRITKILGSMGTTASDTEFISNAVKIVCSFELILNRYRAQRTEQELAFNHNIPIVAFTNIIANDALEFNRALITQAIMDALMFSSQYDLWKRVAIEGVTYRKMSICGDMYSSQIRACCEEIVLRLKSVLTYDDLLEISQAV